MALIHLIYVSTATTECGDAELDRILESSERHNSQQHVTGMLLYCDGNFIQAIEGEESAIDETYGRIAKDPRHTDLFLLLREPIAQRSFHRWSMGFRRLDPAETAAHPAYAPFFKPGFDTASLVSQPGLAMDLLKDFSLRQR
jgi:hypothetical protein